MIIHIQFILLKFLSIVVDLLIVVLWKYFVQQNEHVHVVDQQNQLPVSLHLGLRQTVLLVRVKPYFLLHKVNQLNNAPLDLLQKLSLLVDKELVVVTETVEKKMKLILYLVFLTVALDTLSFLF